ncbi:hypothetical protein K1719_004054 [Acacia pycnantha]|nr:hypothetical protein K1719_004054 [Acacia pycnantha]
MNLANSPIFFFLIIALFSETFLRTLGQQLDWENEGSQNGFGHRVLMSFKENPRGSNVTFECSPSGPCVPCLYSEKGDEKYRCSETGYRIPLKCIESEDSVKSSKKTDSQNGQSTLDSSSTSGNGSQAYITYRSCIPSTTEDKLSVLSFEGIVIFLLLVSGSIIQMRKKKAVSVSGYAALKSSSVHVGGFKQRLLDSLASVHAATGAYLCWALYLLHHHQPLPPLTAQPFLPPTTTNNLHWPPTTTTLHRG